MNKPCMPLRYRIKSKEQQLDIDMKNERVLKRTNANGYTRSMFMREGYTLLEILIVVTIILTLLGGGMISYTRYNSNRVLNQDTTTFVDVINQARQKTIDRDLGTTTNCTTFTGYRVQVVPSTSTYSLYRLCTGVTIPAIATNQLKNSRIQASSTFNIDFQYPYGILLGANQTITIRSNSTTGCQNVQITTAGVITEQSC